MNINEDLIKLISRFPEKQVDINSTDSLKDFVESLDVSEYHYEWQFDGETYNNFNGFEVYVENNENVYECFIWMNYTLDQSHLISSNIRLNETEAIMTCINEFATWFNQRYKQL